MTKRDRIAAIIPVKNRPDVIHRALDSIVAQTRPVDEIIVIDDGSTDSTPDQVEARRAQLPSLRLIRLERSGGAPRARNAGAAATSAEFLAFLDSDDAWAPEKLRLQMDLLAGHPDCPAAFSATLYRFRGKKAQVVAPPPVVRLADLHLKNLLGGASAALVRKNAFDRVGGFRPDMPSCQDWELWLKLAALGDLRSAQEPLLEYFFDGGGRITKNIGNVLKGHEIVYGEICASLNDAKRIRHIQGEHHRRLADIYSRHHFDVGRALFHAASALATDPQPRRLLDVPRVLGRLATYPLI